MEFEKYADGRFDANIDLNDGWIDLDLGEEGITNYLSIDVGATEEYIRGYLDAVDDYLLRNQ